MTAEIQSCDQLRQKKCVPCEGGILKLTPSEAERQVAELDGWQLNDDHRQIRKSWIVKNFMSGIDFLARVAELAEAEDHHPDLHLEGYRNVAIGIWTHAIGGLSQNDFILAAKIDELPVELRHQT